MLTGRRLHFRMEERSISVQPIASVPEVAADNGLQPALLPEFVTPDWLKDNHHLMRADLRKLASAMAEDYSDWPAAVDGSDEGAFWRAVHTLAQRWTWFLWLFEERILKLFGRVKGRKKLLGRLVLKSASERAQALRPAVADVSEETILDHPEILWEEGESVLVAQSVWVLWCIGGPESAYMMSSWLEEPEIERLVGHAVHRSRFRGLGERDDLVDRLKREAGGPHLERLATRADKECAMLRKVIADAYGRLKTHVTEHDGDRPATDLLSYLVLDMAALADELDEIETVRNLALARSRHGALRTLLEGAAGAAGQTALAGEASALTGQIEALLLDTALPRCIPDPEWESCREHSARSGRGSAGRVRQSASGNAAPGAGNGPASRDRPSPPAAAYRTIRLQGCRDAAGGLLGRGGRSLKERGSIP